MSETSTLFGPGSAADAGSTAVAGPAWVAGSTAVAGPAWVAGSAGRPGAIPAGVDDLDAVAALVEAARLRRGANAAEARLLRVAAHWADLHAVLPDDRLGGDAAGHRSKTVIGGVERLVPLAGEGAPAVAEFAPAELGAALGMSTHSAAVLIGNALELRHRLSKLWARVMAGELPAWRACKIADQTKCLSAEAASFVDVQLAPVAHKIGLARVLAVVDAAMKRFDPESAAEKEKQAADRRGVWLSDQMLDGTRSIQIEADALDAQAFDRTISDLAESLRRYGDTDTTDVRRAKAVGTIADPQAALDLLGAVSGTNGKRSADEVAKPPGGGRKPHVNLFVHLHQDAVETNNGIGRVERFGAVTAQKIREWVGRSDVTITGVLDLDSRASVDGHEVPDDMRETVLLRNPCCPFPWCPNLSRTKDMDHIEEYVPLDHGGSPGQTAADKLAGLCRRHHRMKTHGGWTYTMPEPGIYLWRSPHDRRYLVDHTGTSNLDTS